MIKKIIISTFIILILGLGISVLIFFAADNFNPQERTDLTPEPFLCEGRPCNVIFIIPESLSARHMGIYGYERNTTPFVDEFFGKEGIVFENAWSTAPWTWPSFAALFTSQLASDVFVETWEDKLSGAIPTFVDVLERNKIPKFVAHTWTFFPLGKMDSFAVKFEPGERFQSEDPFLFIKATEWIKEQVQKDGGQPFFLLLQPLAPHSPYDPPEPYRYFFDAPSEYPGPIYEQILEEQKAMDRGENVELELRRFRLQYDQEIRYLDGEVESFISRIPEKVRQSTVFIFTSDHGQALGQHVNIANISRRGTVYEEEIHIPFFLRAPGIDPVRIHQPITLLDAGPTILDIFNLESPDTFRGVSLLPILQGKDLQMEKRIVKAENVHYDPFTGEGWLEVEPETRTESLLHPRESAVRKKEWKLIRRADNSLELYNLQKDYWEKNNLISQWHSLSKEEQAEVIPLFELLSITLP